MTAISKNVYVDVLNYIVDEYNNTYHKTIKMKPIDVKCDSFAEYNEESNEKELQKTNQKEFKIEKVIKNKGNKLYVKWKEYNNSFNSWIDKKDLIK